MTGFGAGTARLGDVTVEVELRSVNSRHLKLNIRLPNGAQEWEPALRELLSDDLRRGHVECAVRVDAGNGQGPRVVLDEPRVEATLVALRNLAERYGLPGEVDLPLLLSCGEMLRPDPAVSGEQVAFDGVREAVEKALVELIAMREREGERLEEDLRGRIAFIDEGLQAAEARAPERVVRERERLQRAVSELTGGLELDPERLAREIAVIADRWDVSEELCRARAHIAAFRELLDAPGPEPVGKRLSFLGQELLRELNTLGSKANDAAISRLVVEMKNELESLREQVENVE